MFGHVCNEHLTIVHNKALTIALPYLGTALTNLTVAISPSLSLPCASVVVARADQAALDCCAGIV